MQLFPWNPIGHFEFGLFLQAVAVLVFLWQLWLPWKHLFIFNPFRIV
jgi:hypothetical protein